MVQTDAGHEAMRQEVLPKAGLVYSENGNLSELLCKPKVMAIKSPSLEKLEEMEKMAMDYELQRQAEEAAAAAQQ